MGYHKIPLDISGVLVTDVSPRLKDFLEVGDAIVQMDGLAVGDDGTVRMRGDELLNYDFLITGKKLNEEVRFSILRQGEAMTITHRCVPLPPTLPRTHAFDCYP